MDITKKEQLEARLRDLMKEHDGETAKPEKRSFQSSALGGNVIRRRKGQPTKRIV